MIQRPNTKPGSVPSTRFPGQGEITYSTERGHRTIVQIAATYDASEEIQEDSLYALCSDGTVWRMIWEGDEDGDRSHWMRLADIPKE